MSSGQRPLAEFADAGIGYHSAKGFSSKSDLARMFALTDCVEKVVWLNVCDDARSRARVSLPFSGRCWGRPRDQLCNLSKVLGGCSEAELVTSMPL
jgi:hypothetical protein